MPELSRSQLLLYGAIAVALLLLGARWIRSADRGAAPAGSVHFSSSSSPGVDDSGDLVVDVAGEVRRPGVYRMPAGARVDDAIKRAGGVDGGDADAINLAARLSDGQQIVVPARSGAGAASSGGAAAASDAPISLGSATVDQLDTIEGIGPVTAQKIVDYRDQHGGFSSVEQLDRVPGIGPATMEALKARLQP